MRRLLDRAVHALDLPVGPGVIGLGESVLDAVLVADALKDMPAQVPVGAPAPVLGCSANAIPLSVSTAWILYGKATATSCSNAAPLSFVAASKKATWVNFETRSMARNMCRLPCDRRSALLSMWT